ncbi:MAG: family acetyltransferase [Adhaeribacter sp.]|nr:family acetyltransferase [Adhaeribacter sp.]
MSVIFESATVAQVPQLLKLQQEFYAIDHYPFHSDKAALVWHHFLQKPELGRVWLINPAAEAEAIGYVALTFCYSFEFGGNISFLDELFIQPAWQKQGFGTQTLNFVMEQAGQLNLKVLHLEAERHNLAGKALYHKFGFRDHDRHLLTKKL